MNPLIAVAGIGALSEGINAVVQSGQNRTNRRYADWQYNRSRKHALEDYNMQNQYNSPAAQMERLKAAGLNPNLVYGTGAGSMTAAPIKSGATNAAQGEAPKVNLGGAVGQYLNAEQMKLQNDNLRAQNTVLLEQAKNIAADTLGKGFGANLKEFDFNFKTETRNQDLYSKLQKNINAYRQGNLTQAQIANTISRTNTENALRQPRLQNILASTSESLQRAIAMRIQMAKSTAEIDEITQRVINAKKTGELQDLEIKLKKLGVSWSDPAWQRKLIMLLDNL